MNPRTLIFCLEADLDESFHFVVDESSFRPNENRGRPAYGMRARLGRARMGQQSALPSETWGQDFSQQRIKMTMELDVWKNRVARLLEPEQQPLANRFGPDDMALPETLFGSRRADDEKALHAEARDRRDEPTKDGWPWQGENDLQRALRGWVAIEFDLEIERFFVETDDTSRSETTPDDSDPQRISRPCAKDLDRMASSAPLDADSIGARGHFIRLDQKTVHCRIAPRFSNAWLLECRRCLKAISSKPPLKPKPPASAFRSAHAIRRSTAIRQ
jgi:hypothetical protein